jgi:hypothetical protein
MRWDLEIDRAITCLLINKEPSYDSDIYEHLRKSSQKKISPTTYSAHKKKLIAADIIEKIEEDEESRGRIKYGITKKAKERYSLGILLFNTTDEISFRNIQPQEEKQLKAFFILLFYATRRYICIKHKLLRMYDKYPLPGFNIPEILNESSRLVLPDDVFSRSVIQKSVDLLANEGIIKKIAVNDGELGYDLDPLLKLFFESFWKIWNNLVESVLAKWDYVKSLDEEREWFKQIFGKRKVDAIERFHYSRRLSFRKSADPRTIQRDEEGLEKKVNYVDGKFRRMLQQNAEITKKYRCLIEPFLEFLYPTALRKRYRSPYIITNTRELLELISTSSDVPRTLQRIRENLIMVSSNKKRSKILHAKRASVSKNNEI